MSSPERRTQMLLLSSKRPPQHFVRPRRRTVDPGAGPQYRRARQTTRIETQPPNAVRQWAPNERANSTGRGSKRAHRDDTPRRIVGLIVECQAKWTDCGESEKLILPEWVPNQRHAANFPNILQISAILGAFDAE
ncbi:hypothetical protein L596_029788 [Steinernema carpocapsae]|uniref:Uncharacterized protein n=1 Tax=Steinernema carpocapsae TaxID=34508 RepID=A0A4U5LQU1_STECR|nr:hypothetical protein L596_029788 [Steinernema carpocapsae]